VFGYKKILGGSSEFFESEKNKKSGASPKEKNLTNNLYQNFLKNALCVFFETIVSNVKLFLTEKYSRLKFLMTKYPYLLRRLGTNMLQADRDSFRITFLEFFMNGKLLQDLVLKKREDLTTDMIMLAKSQQSSSTANKFLVQTSPAQEKVVWSVSLEGSELIVSNLVTIPSVLNLEVYTKRAMGYSVDLFFYEQQKISLVNFQKSFDREYSINFKTETLLKKFPFNRASISRPMTRNCLRALLSKEDLNQTALELALQKFGERIMARHPM
jgi:hypothetical protein